MTETIHSVLIAYDFSPCADRALEMGLTIADRFQSTVFVLNVINRRDIAAIEQAVNRSLLVAEQVSTGDYVREYEADRTQDLKERLAKFPHANLSPQALLRIGDPVEEILEIAKVKNVDLIVMGARGRNRVSRLLTGSKAETVFRLSPIPVLSVRMGSESAS